MAKKLFLYIAAFSSMFIMGCIDSMRGPMIPGIRSTFSINYSSIGVMFFVAGLGYVIATFLGGLVCDRLGQKKVMFFGFICAMLGIAGISFSMNFGMFLFMMGFLNIGLGAIEIGANTLVSGITIKNQAVMMNLAHFFYGLGASIGPGYSGGLLSIGVSWKNIYLISLTASASILIYISFVKFPEYERHGREDTMPVWDIIRDGKVLLFGSALGFYVSSELGIANWFSNYLTTVHGMDGLKSSYYLSLFFVVFTLGRLFGGVIVEKLGYLNAVLSCMVAALILFTSGLILGRDYAVLISMAGLFCSIVFPTMVTVVANEFKKSTSFIVGFVITMGAGTNMVANWFIGRVNDMLGVKAGFTVVIGYMSIVIILVSVLRGMVQCRHETLKAGQTI